jgi:hypothetical protein
MERVPSTITKKESSSPPIIRIYTKSDNNTNTGSVVSYSNARPTINSSESETFANRDKASNRDDQNDVNHQRGLVDEEDDNVVDSALLSALHDPRERFALLKLEHVLIDFMNDQSCAYIDVGGSFNSVVIKSHNSHTNNCDNDTTTALTSEAVSYSNYNSSGTVRMQPNTNPLLEGSGRQTTFHRLCLHRLADRFNIIRDTAVWNNNISASSTNPGLIRLVKVKNSRIPKKLLIDIDVSAVSPNPSVMMSNNAGTTYASGTGDPQDKMNDITDRFSLTQIQDATSTSNSGGISGSKKSKKKVMIMKRSSSKGSSGSLNTNDGGDANSDTAKRKGKKNLSDKEKAYAEARARIFNTTEENNNNNNNSPSSSTNANIPVDSGPPPMDDYGTVEESTIVQNIWPARLNNATDPEENTVPTNTYSPSSKNDPDSPRSSPTPEMSETNGTLYSKSGNIPAAATSGATSKVTWRNRQQEASDPDFRRRHHPVLVAPLTSPNVTSPSNSNVTIYHHPHYPNNGQVMVANHLTHASMSNYHYGNNNDSQQAYSGYNAPIASMNPYGSQSSNVTRGTSYSQNSNAHGRYGVRSNTLHHTSLSSSYQYNNSGNPYQSRDESSKLDEDNHDFVINSAEDFPALR